MRSKKVHAYAASFADELARDLILANTSRGETVLDAFAGACTTVIQARALQRLTIAIDVDPVACLIGKVLTNTYDPDATRSFADDIMVKLRELEAHLGTLKYGDSDWAPGYVEQAGQYTARVPGHEKVEFWFAPVQRAILAHLVGIANELGESANKDLIRVAISSSIIHKWPNTLSLAKDIDHTRPHRVVRADLSVTDQLRIFRRAFCDVIGVVTSIQSATLPRTQIIQGDAKAMLEHVPAESVDYVLTSPPYFNAIDYPRSHQFVRWWLWSDEPKLSRGSYIGLRSTNHADYRDVAFSLLKDTTVSQIQTLGRDHPAFNRFCRYVVDLDGVVAGLVNALRPGKSMTFVVGNNTIDGVVLPVAEVMEDIFGRHSLTNVQVSERALAVAHRRYPNGCDGFKGLMQAEYLIAGVKLGPRHAAWYPPALRPSGEGRRCREGCRE